MGDKKGINSPESLEGVSGWYIVDQAECDDGLTDLEQLFDESDGSDISNLLDDGDEVDQGNSLALLNVQLLEESAKQLADLKRKYLSPSKDLDVDLSPRLQSVSLSSESKNSRRRLFDDSGIGHEAEDTLGAAQVESESIGAAAPDTVLSASENGANICEELLRSNNLKAAALAKFKLEFGVSYNDLTRIFKSNKSCCNSWCIAAFGVLEELIESSKTLLKTHCDYCQIIVPSLNPKVIALYLCEFKCAKNRETVQKLFGQLLNVEEKFLFSDPPKHRSVVVALYFFKQSMSSMSFKFGAFPDWLAKQTIVSHQVEAETFSLSKMVQWAFDHRYTDESVIAYNYACCAEDDPNAAAWLNCNNQLKFVKDCAQMTRHYIRQEMRNMSMSDWIYRCCDKVKEPGDWKIIAKFLRYQEVNMLSFLTAFRLLLKGVPKKHCIVFSGKPNTGKSYFAYSLIAFLEGKVVSYMNSKSQFWLSPLADTKFGLLDDATDSAWTFMDIYMRGALDGNSISIDCKHKNPIQLKLPAMFITTNVPVDKEIQYSYLQSRLQVFTFDRDMPLDSFGEPVFKITDETWASFFIKLEKQLGLSRSSEDGEPERAFRCIAGEHAGTV
ncbi:E1 [Macaca mulatta papillomavirus 5]|uniref:E1 n=1 Tax=Macaca mulatta papillomavirus 5 TaxID=2364645 RepID=UPI000EB66623|nr:E1 [Macaca mulatta papillomavirus 5]AYD74600.1 E1 [Macaca mulatta papillomavirus 5]